MGGRGKKEIPRKYHIHGISYSVVKMTMCHLLNEYFASARLCVYVYMLVHANMGVWPTLIPCSLCLLPYSTRARPSCHTDDALHSLISFYMSSSECPFRASFLAEFGGSQG